MNLEVAIEHLLIGPLIIIISYIFANYPLKKINNLYGYKKKRSMRKQDYWYFTNRHSICLMRKISLLTCLIQMIGVILLDKGLALQTASIVLITTLIYSFYLTEEALKNTFVKRRNRL